MEDTTVEAVQCDNCKRLHKVNSPDYVKFHGMLTVGEQGGLIGPQPSVHCRSGVCGQQLIDYLEKFIGLLPAH